MVSSPKEFRSFPIFTWLIHQSIKESDFGVTSKPFLTDLQTSDLSSQHPFASANSVMTRFIIYCDLFVCVLF